MRRDFRRLFFGSVLSSLLLFMVTAPGLASDWLQFDGNPPFSGVNSQEITINRSNVASLSQVFRLPLPAVADGAPALLSLVNTPKGYKDLLFMTTKAGHILAMDARSGEIVWSHQNPAGSCRINNGPAVCYTTASPAVDPNRKYVYSYGLDGYVHKYQVGDGTEITTGGWPELTTQKPYNEKGSSDLNIATAADGTSYLYVSNGGYPGDQGDYQGHITVINLATGAQRVFNTVCSDQSLHFVETPGNPDCPEVQSAVWARVGVVYVPETDKIYLATGNGTFDPAHHDWGDTVLALNPDGSGLNGDPLDSYTPADFQQLQDQDADLGSTSPAVIPVPPESKVRHLAVQGGKDQLLRLLNLDDLSGQGGPGHTGGEIGAPIPVPQGGGVLTRPAVWTDVLDGSVWVFVTSTNGISGLKLVIDAQGIPSLNPVWQSAVKGTSPLVANDVLYYASPGSLRALNPLNGDLLWKDNTIGSIHWESPIVVNGVLYVTDENSQITAYALNGQIAPLAVSQVFLPVNLR